MALWMVRAGRFGEQENLALDKGIVVVGDDNINNLSGVKTREELYSLYEQAYPEAKKNTRINWVGQMWAFISRIQVGDLVVLPLKSRSAIAIGKIKGEYEYHADYPDGAHHTRPVEWLITDKPRSAFDQDLLYSFGAFMTVCQIKRNNAEERIKAMLAGKPTPISPETIPEELLGEGITDLEQYARDQIRDYIGRKFKGHELARLVQEILAARGYYTLLSPPGADGGVDIVAGRGTMGFDEPRLCVQVKSGDSPVDVGVLRELQGTMRNFGSEQGLLVSWGGFKSSVLKEARRIFFEIRLWDADNVVRALMENYEDLSDEIQAEIPLKRTWVLVLEE